jgi:hypothetical protein
LEAAPEKLRKAVEEEEAKRAEAAALFDIDEFISDAEKVRTVYVKEINRKIKYKKISVVENGEIAKMTDADERARAMLYTMLHKADNKITKEKINALSSDVATVILTTILSEQTFLQKSAP